MSLVTSSVRLLCSQNEAQREVLHKISNVSDAEPFELVSESDREVGSAPHFRPGGPIEND